MLANQKPGANASQEARDDSARASSIFVEKSDLSDTGSEITQLHILNKQILW